MSKGGKRAGAGRPRGRKNKFTIALQEAALQAAASLPAGSSAVEFMRAVYQNPEFDVAVRLKAAADAAPYESPRLASIEHAGAGGGPIQTEDLSAMSSEERAQRLALLVAGLSVPTTH